MHSRASTSPYEQRTTRQAVPAAALAELLACVLCLVCFGFAATQAAADSAPAEPAAAESPADAREARCEHDEMSGGGSGVPHGRTSRSATPSTRTSFEPGSAHHATAGTFAIASLPFVFTPPLLMPVAARRVIARACIAQTFLASVRPRGPTSLT